MIRFDDEPLNILDYVANHCGYLKIELVPCNQKGAESDKLSVNDPMDLVRIYFDSVVLFISMEIHALWKTR